MKYLNLQKHKFGSKKSIIYCSFIFIFFCIFFSLTKITTEIASGLKVNELKLEIGSEQNFQNIFYEKQPNQESFNNSNTNIYHGFFNQSYGFHDANAGHNHSNSNQPF